MAPRPIDEQIDRLYQLPLDEFTAARNVLAKAAGPAAAEVKALPKPPLAAWAINQVYWRGRPAFHALMASAAALRTAHMAVTSGKRGDLRAAGEAHEAALEAVLKAALAILKDAGHPPTDGTKQAIANTLRALPASTEPPGRLTVVLQPTGFELLAGLQLAASAGRGSAAPKAAPAPAPKPAPPRTKDAAHERAVAKAKDAVAAAQRTERTADEAARRDEFEAAKAARDAERAATALAKARAAFEDAQEALATAEREADETARKKDAAARRVRESATALAAAKVKTEAAQAALARL